MALKPAGRGRPPEAELRSLLEPFEPQGQKLFRAVRATLRRRFPAANELVYEYSDSVVLTYSATERGLEGILSLALRADGVRLYLAQGPRLPDPQGLLEGSGSQVRFLRVESIRALAQPAVAELIAAALERAKVPFSSAGQGRLLVRPTAASVRKKRRQTK